MASSRHRARRSEIGRHEPALDVFHVDQVRQIVDQRAKKVVLLCERFLACFRSLTSRHASMT